MEEGRIEAGDTKDGGGSDPDGGENVAKKGQQELMQNWMRGQVPTKGSEGRQRQLHQQTNKGGQEQSKHQENKETKRDECQSQNQKDEQLQHQDKVKEKEKPQKKKKQEARMQWHRTETNNCKYGMQKQGMNATPSKVSLAVKVMSKKEQCRRKLTAWFTTLLLLLRRQEMETNQEDKTFECSIQEEGFL